MKALLFLALAARAASADCLCELAEKLNGGAYLREELTIVTHVDDHDPSGIADRGAVMATPGARAIDSLSLAGFRLHGFIGRDERVGYHLGIELAGGMTTGRHGGFAYEAAFEPIGFAVKLGRSSFLTVGTGMVASGASGALDDTVAIPLDLDLELDATRVRLIAWGRASWVAGAPGRVGGAPFGDQLEAIVGLRLGHHYEDYGYPSGNGAFVGIAYKELMGTAFLGLTVGYSIDVATPPHPN